MIRASDGLDYEDLAARLLARPASTPRNQAVKDLLLPPNDPRAAPLFAGIYDLEYAALVQGHGPESAQSAAMEAARQAVGMLHRVRDHGAAGVPLSRSLYMAVVRLLEFYPGPARAAFGTVEDPRKAAA